MRAIIVMLLVSACGGGGTGGGGPANRKAGPPPSKASACDTLVVALDGEGTWIGAPPHVACRAAHKGGGVDAAWVAAELTRIRGALDAACRPEVEVTATGGTYQDLVSSIDAAIAAGFLETWLSDAAPAMSFAGWTPAARCEGELANASRSPARSPRAEGDPRTAPRIHVSKTELGLDGVTLAALGELGATGEIGVLGEKLRGMASKGIVVLQADTSTPAQLVLRIVATAKASGFASPLLVVDSR